jgi:branched-chain amino acid transport system substrate-binding protein
MPTMFQATVYGAAMHYLKAIDAEGSHGEWDLAKVIATIPGEQALRLLSETECPLARH